MRKWVVLFCLASTVSAAVITPTVGFGSGVYTYGYSVENDGTVDLIGFQVALPVAPTNIQTPDGWVSNDFADAGMTVLQWFSISDDIQPSETLAGFGFDAPTAPASVAFVVTDAELKEQPGATIGPAAIPEPASMQLFGLAAAVSVGLLRARRRVA